MKEIQIYIRTQHYDNILDFSLESKKLETTCISTSKYIMLNPPSPQV